jgi:uncharacterized protein YabN with tetrapyrrole methylase and pyrophosphatase domain
MTDGRGSLWVVGTGIKLAAHCTAEARGVIEAADVVFAAADNFTLEWLRRLNSDVRTLTDLYGEGRTRRHTYESMTERILAAVREGQQVAAVFYGHPGVFVDPSHDAVHRARDEGYHAVMLPGVSAEDCLFADLGFDPGRLGCQSYEATDFVINARTIDPTAALILWQIAVVGDRSLREFESRPERLALLEQILLETYPADHEVVVYEAAPVAVVEPRLDRMPLGELHGARVKQTSTLYVAPLRPPRADPSRVAMFDAIAVAPD